MSENETLAVNFQIDSPEIEVALLGTQDKYVALLEEGMNVSINPFADQLAGTHDHQTVCTLKLFGCI